MTKYQNQVILNNNNVVFVLCPLLFLYSQETREQRAIHLVRIARETIVQVLNFLFKCHPMSGKQISTIDKMYLTSMFASIGLFISVPKQWSPTRHWRLEKISQFGTEKSNAKSTKNFENNVICHLELEDFPGSKPPGEPLATEVFKLF